MAKREIQIGGIRYLFSFIIADVKRSILGINFLQQCKMSIDFEHRQLLHSGRTTAFSSASRVQVSGVNVVRNLGYDAEQLLRRYPEITNVAAATRSFCHGVECHIPTTGLPIKTPPRRLTPEKSDIELRLRTDASERAIAGAVHQVVGDQEQSLAFFSRCTTAAESRYSV